MIDPFSVLVGTWIGMAIAAAIIFSTRSKAQKRDAKGWFVKAND